MGCSFAWFPSVESLDWEAFLGSRIAKVVWLLSSRARRSSGFPRSLGFAFGKGLVRIQMLQMRVKGFSWGSIRGVPRQLLISLLGLPKKRWSGPGIWFQEMAYCLGGGGRTMGPRIELLLVITSWYECIDWPLSSFRTGLGYLLVCLGQVD